MTYKPKNKGSFQNQLRVLFGEPKKPVLTKKPPTKEIDMKYPYLIALTSDAYKRAVAFAQEYPIQGAMRLSYQLSAMQQDLANDFQEACQERYGVDAPPLDANALLWVIEQESKLFDCALNE
jgi:hypothetical protein